MTPITQSPPLTNEMNEPPAISLIIPAYNEADYLPRLLASIRQAQVTFPSVEIIVADNMSSDSTASIALSFGARVVSVEKRMIAAARNGGAAIACGKILAFVDSDSLLHPNTFTAIAHSMQNPKIIGGATGILFDRTSLGIACTYWLFKPIVMLLGMESGVVFCRREDFVRLGGYPENERIAEDVNWLFKLKRDGRQRGQRFAILRGVKTLTSARKFDRYGDWHALAQVPRLVFTRLFSKRRFDAAVDRYWYKR